MTVLALGLVLNGGRREYQEVFTPRAEPQHRDALLLLNEWRRLADTGGFIVGIHVPSRVLAGVLCGLTLFQPIDDRDYRVRLAGSSVLRRFGRDITGLRLSDFCGEDFAQHRAQMRRVQTTGEPFVLHVDKLWQGSRYFHFELVGLQVFSPDCRDPWVMTGQFLLPD
jgi:hypothetical protein